MVVLELQDCAAMGWAGASQVFMVASHRVHWSSNPPSPSLPIGRGPWVGKFRCCNKRLTIFNLSSNVPFIAVLLFTSKLGHEVNGSSTAAVNTDMLCNFTQLQRLCESLIGSRGRKSARRRHQNTSRLANYHTQDLIHCKALAPAQYVILSQAFSSPKLEKVRLKSSFSPRIESQRTHRSSSALQME